MRKTVDWLQRRAELTSEKTALKDEIHHRTIDYGEWNLMANKMANYLQKELGLKLGDRIAILASNSVEYLTVLFACQKCGFVLQNLNWRLAAPELNKLIQHAEPKVLLYTQEFVEVIRVLESYRLASPELFIAMEQKAAEHHLALSDYQQASDALPLVKPMSVDAPWMLCYTGGTTGLPKGVIITHDNVLWNAVNSVTSWNLDASDVAILNAPLFHVSGLHIFTTPLIHAGGTSVVCRAFDIDQMYDLIDRGDVTIFFAVPTVFIMMQNHPRWETTSFAHLKFIITGGAPCPLPVMRKFWEKGAFFTVGYGLTEAGPNTFSLAENQIQQKAGYVGYPLMNIETRLVDNKGQPITNAYQSGELLIRGSHRTPGYWGNPAATRKAIDTEGWLHTGDLAMTDEDGAYRIVGRVKDMYISGGENVYPAEVESVMFGHTEIADCAVFGIPHGLWGEVGAAIVVKRPGSNLGHQQIAEFLKGKLAKYKIPKVTMFVDELPKTAAGKVSKEVLKTHYLEALVRDICATDPTAEMPEEKEGA